MNIIFPSHDYLFFLLPCPVFGLIKFIFGRIKNGKTYIATKQAVKVLRDGGLVISNYPIYDKKTGRSAVRWKDEYFEAPIHDALIILDEAHRMIKGLAGKDHENYDEDKAAFFAASSHNNNEIILIAHSFTRYGPSIREAAEEFVEVKKTCMPFTGKALWFTQKTSDSIKGAESRVWPEWWLRKRTFFNLQIAECYDYHFFVKAGEEPEYEPWVLDLREPSKKLKGNNINLEDPFIKTIKKEDKREPLLNTIKKSVRRIGIFKTSKIIINALIESIRRGFIAAFKSRKIGNSVFYTWLGLIVFTISMLSYYITKVVF